MSSEDRIIEILIGNRTMARKRTRKTSLLHRENSAGFRFSMLVAFQERYHLSQEQLQGLIDIPERIVMQRKPGKRLTKTESDRLYRVARIAAITEEMLGSSVAAECWLKDANPALGNVTPLSLMVTDEGTQTVADVLGRIEHGVYS